VQLSEHQKQLLVVRWLETPEAFWKLAGGGAQRNHRNTTTTACAPTGRRNSAAPLGRVVRWGDFPVADATG